MTQISIVSGTYNRLSLLKNMIESVRACVDDFSYEIVLVDGGSTDGTLEWCLEQEDVVLIEQGELVGIAGAFNTGFAAARGDYVVVVNDDIVMREGTIRAAYDYLEGHGDVGQVAFYHEFQRKRDKFPKIDKAFGYVYGQCCMIRRWLGDFAGWWGTEYHSYGGDTQLSMVLWEHGWKVIPLQECRVIDFQHEDKLREDRRKLLQGDPSFKNVDSKKFYDKWTDKLIDYKTWIPINHNNINYAISQQRLRVVRLINVPLNSYKRVGFMKSIEAYGTGKLVNYQELLVKGGSNKHAVNELLDDEIVCYNPDIVITQIQRMNEQLFDAVCHLKTVLPETTKIVNIDGDARFPLRQYHYKVASIVDLQLVSSGTAVKAYTDSGYYNVGWLVFHSGEDVHFDVSRDYNYEHDVVFLGSYYKDVFPESETRIDAIKSLTASGIDVDVYGNGWNSVSITTKGKTNEQHELNAQIYSKSKLALSISAFTNLYGYSSNRLYIICATGCPALVQRFDGMEQLGFIDGETCIAWTTMDELIEKAKYALEDDDWREEIGRAGRELMLQRHTYEHRVAELLSMLEPLEEVSCFKTQMY